MQAAAALTIRPFVDDDWRAVWDILCPVFRAGETYPVATDITEEAARAYWTMPPLKTYVAAVDDGDIVGSYYIKPNQPTLGAHVCNCGYVIAESVRGQGFASRLCEHSQHEAIALGYRAMQYNLVVATNEIALRVWTKNGFAVVGALGEAFQHKRLGFVDAYVMYKCLSSR